MAACVWDGTYQGVRHLRNRFPDVFSSPKVNECNLTMLLLSRLSVLLSMHPSQSVSIHTANWELFPSGPPPKLTSGIGFGLCFLVQAKTAEEQLTGQTTELYC